MLSLNISTLKNKTKYKKPAKVISLLNQKGGVGKTTLTFHLAHALKQLDKKILCIDLDPQGNLSHLFNISLNDQEYCPIFQLLVNSLRELKNLHQPYLVSDSIFESNGVSIIPSGPPLSGFELTVAGVKRPRQLILKHFLEKSGLHQLFDYILIDGPPTLGLLVVNILCSSHGVLIPFRPDEFSQKGLHHFYQTLDEIEEMGIVDRPKVLGLIPNLLEGRRKTASTALVNIENDLIELNQQRNVNYGPTEGPTIFSPVANKVLIERACSQKKSIFDYSGKDYKELQDQFLYMAKTIVKGEL